ncbi:MAG: MBL fold metallo-hydrolase [Bdellovibrionales bacterium]
MQVASLKLKIGRYEVLPVRTGLFALDGGAMFGTVPKALWEKTNPADDQNRIPLEARALLLKSKDMNVLVDVGVGGDFIEKYGEKMGSKFAEIYAVQNSPNADSLEKSLNRWGLKPQDIHHVILTHLHFDHAGGATKWESGKLVPTFPNAKYYVQKANLETARKPNIREKASYLKPNFEPLIESHVVQLLDGDVKNLLPNLSVFVTNGHTLGQQLVRVEDEKSVLTYCGDIIPTSSHVRLPFVMGYDLNPLMVIEEKSHILAETSKKNGYLYFEHDPYCDVGQIVSQGEDYRLAAGFTLS